MLISGYNVSIIDQRRGVYYLGVEEYIPDRIAGLSEKRGYTKYRLSQITGMTQTALGNILSQKSGYVMHSILHWHNFSQRMGVGWI